MTTHTLTIPNWLPPKVNDYEGRHWSRKLRAKREVAGACGFAALQCGVPIAEGPRRVSFTLSGWGRGGALPDPDGFLDALLDGLVAAGLLLNDSQGMCLWERPVLVRSKARKTVIILEDLP